MAANWMAERGMVIFIPAANVMIPDQLFLHSVIEEAEGNQIV